jgi:hypothetical protein
MPCIRPVALACGAVAVLLALPGPASPPGAPPLIVVPPPATVAPRLPAADAPPAAPRGCLPGGNGYLRARIRGALNVDLDWHNDEIECAGGPRPDGSGIRLSFAGPRQPNGQRLRLLFGVGSAREGRGGRELPTNLTVIVEGAQRLFTTRGEDHCTVDRLRQERLATPGGAARSYRVVARGFCISTASTLNNAEHILVSSFDFAGEAVFGYDPQRP